MGDPTSLPPPPHWSPRVVQPVLLLIAGKWDLPVLRALDAGPLRLKSLQLRIGSVSRKILTETVQRLVNRGLVRRVVVSAAPVEVDYVLTPRARSLWPFLEQLHQWALCDVPAPVAPPEEDTSGLPETR